MHRAHRYQKVKYNRIDSRFHGNDIKGAEMKEKDKESRIREMLIDSNRRLQETAQKLLILKQELEKKNQELEAARLREKQQIEQLERELKGFKHLVNIQAESFQEITEKKLTERIAEELSLRYIQLLRNYLEKKQLDKEEPLTEELCQRLIKYGVSPKGIIDLHLKATPLIRTIDDLETKRITFEARMVLLAVMTKYASILRRKVIKK